MKPPWYQPAADVELEALQTDVMRFVAILGLCLAAIFSLVQGAVVEETTAKAASRAKSSPPPRQQTRVQTAPAMLPERAVITPQPVPAEALARSAEAAPAPAPVVAEREVGFSLEFASDAALMELLAQGQLRLFAKVDGHFWALDSGAGVFATALVTGSYHRMLPATVPSPLHSKLAHAAGAAASEWGVQLTAKMTRQLQRIMRERSGGNLLIQADGSIAVE